MPTEIAADGSPVVRFDPALEVSPFRLLQRLQSDSPPMLVDLREAPGELALEGSIPWPGEAWLPPPATDVVLIDDDGGEAFSVAEALRSRGADRVRALFGGLELYAFCLDPEVVGTETFLRRS